jgi:RHS repeat-associated protein
MQKRENRRKLYGYDGRSRRLIRITSWSFLVLFALVLAQISYTRQAQPSPPTRDPVRETPSFNGVPTATDIPEPENNPACICPSSRGKIGTDSACAACASAGASTGIDQDTGGHTVYLHNGEFIHHVVDLEIPGRGLNWRFERKYRSSVVSDGPLGHNWDFNYNRRLAELTATNLNEAKRTFPAAKVGDVVRMDGNSRIDLYVRNSDGSFGAPIGFFTQLVKNDDGSFIERDSVGTTIAYEAPTNAGLALMTSWSDHNNNTMKFEYNAQDQLVRVLDTLGRPINYNYNAEGRLVAVRGFSGRSLVFQYDAKGDLVAATTPTVTETPNGNDFPFGKTTRYSYSSGFEDQRLNHNLLTITAPNEVLAGGPARFSLTYETAANSVDIDRVKTQTVGGTNASGVAAGGTISYQYKLLTNERTAGDILTAVFQTTVTDRNGNLTEYQFNRLGNTVRIREFSNRQIRQDDPEFFETRYEFNNDGLLLKTIYPEGNSVENVYDSRNIDRFQQGNVLSQISRPDAKRGGDQEFLRSTTSYEPIFNQLRSITEPRGNDPKFVPQNGGATSPERYTTINFYDYQEGNNFAGLAKATGKTEAQVRELLKNIPMNLGDLNGDGKIDQIAGNIVKIQSPTITLLSDSKQAQIEGSTKQAIARLLGYNAVGQLIREVDAEGNVTLYEYFPENDPDGDGKELTPGMSANPFGYSKAIVKDAERGANRNSKTDPEPTRIRTQFFYDEVGNLIKEIDGRGIATEYIVNQLNQVVERRRASDVSNALRNGEEPKWASCTDSTLPECKLGMVAFGYKSRFFYDANDNMTKRQIENRDSNNVELVGQFIESSVIYDILDKPVELTQEISENESRTVKYRYDKNSNRVLLISPMATSGKQPSNVISEIYDERDLLASQTRGGLTDQFKKLDAHENIAELAKIPNSALMATTSRRYDANRNLKESFDAADNSGDGAPESKTLLYDGFDRLVSGIDALGNQGLQEYDPAGNVVRFSSFGPVGGKSPNNNKAATFTQPLTLQSIKQPLLKQTKADFDELNRKYHDHEVLFDYSKIGVRYQRTPQHQDGPLFKDDDGETTTRFEFDRNGRVTFLVYDDGNTGRIYYDGAGRSIRWVCREGNEELYRYDDNGNIVEKTEIDVTQRTHIQAGRIPDLREVFTTIYLFDSLDRVLRKSDNLGQTTRWSYDSRGNLLSVSDAQHSNVATDLIPDPFGLVAPKINRAGNIFESYYDGLGRIIANLQQLRVAGQGKNLIETANPANPDGLVVQDYAYDLNNNVIARADDGSQSSDQNTSIGLIEANNAKGNVTRYLFDELNRLKQEIMDDGSLHDFVYDGDDNILRFTDENGSITTNSYDSLNRISRQQIARATSTTAHPAGGTKDTKANWQVIGSTLLEFEYDGLSRMTRSFANNDPDKSSDDAVVTRAYDSMSRLLEEVQNGLPISNRWNGDDTRSELFYPNGRTLQATYDKHDRLDVLKNKGGSIIAEYDYLGSTRVLERTYGNGAKLSYLDAARQKATGFDGVRRVINAQHLLDKTLIAGFVYGYDRLENKLFEIRQHENNRREDYLFDSLYRLTSFAKEGATETWQLDGAHNWAMHNGQSNTTNNLHQYTSFEGKAQSYDENGNLLENATLRMQYDAQNLLRRVFRKSDNALIAEYSYDAQGRRIRKIVTNSGSLNGEFTYFYDGWQEIEERAANLTQQYVYGIEIDEPISFDRDTNNDGKIDQTFYYHQDGKRSVIALTDAKGQVIERISYSAYGVPNLKHSSVGNPYLFSAQRFEPETGLYYYRARFQDPEQGRFVQRDPVQPTPLGNPYAYVENNPISLQDPMGLAVLNRSTGNVGAIVEMPTSPESQAGSSGGGCASTSPLFGSNRGKARTAYVGRFTPVCTCGSGNGINLSIPRNIAEKGSTGDPTAVVSAYVCVGYGSNRTCGFLFNGGTGGTRPDGTEECCGTSCSCDPPPPSCCNVSCSCGTKPSGGDLGLANPSGDPAAGEGGGGSCPAGKRYVCVTIEGKEYCGCVGGKLKGKPMHIVNFMMPLGFTNPGGDPTAVRRHAKTTEAVMNIRR